jgi:peptidoglycan/LPS O-acetylase OafA/YrhL
MSQLSANRIPSLDGLRAISIIMVLGGHLALQHAGSEQSARYFELLANLGVRVFFVISGFLITGLLLRELDTQKKINLPKFYYRRTLRIFPPYYVFIGAMGLLHALGTIQLAPHDIPHALTYSSNYYPERSWYMGHTWSLAVEEQFYLLFPAALLALGRKRGLVAAASLILLCPLIRLVVRQYPPFQGYESGKTFETLADALAVGCTLAGAHTWLHTQQAYRRLLASRLFVLIPLCIIAVTLLQSGRPLFKIAAFTFVNIGLALCLDWAVTNYKGTIGRALNAPAVTFIGVMSYSIYLWQQLFLHPDSPYLLSKFPFNLLMIVITALISFYVIERPSLKLRQRWEGILFPKSIPNSSQSQSQEFPNVPFPDITGQDTVTK